MRPIRVLVIEDSEPYVRGLQDYFNPGGEFLIVGVAGSLAEALSKAQTMQPKVAVVDLYIPVDPSTGLPAPAHGLRAIAELKRVVPGLHILAVSFARDLGLAVQAAIAGADGFLNKDASFDKWLATLRRISRGESEWTAEQIAAIIRELTDPGDLTEREVEVLRLLAEGRNSAEIAAALNIAPATAQTHVRAIMRKLNVATRQEAVEKARRQRLL